jgi:hypothetical protein
MMPKRLPNGPACSFLPRPSGNMPAGRGQLHDITQGIRKKILIGPDGIIKIPGKTASGGRKRTPMPLVCMTCTAMFGNGVRIIGMTITMEHLMMAVPGWIKMRARFGSCAAARGTRRPSLPDGFRSRGDPDSRFTLRVPACPPSRSAW